MKIMYQCEVCNACYPTESEALACERQPIPPRPPVEVGKYYKYMGNYYGYLDTLRLIKHRWVGTFNDYHDGTNDIDLSGSEGIDILIWRIGFYYNGNPKLEAQS